MRHRVILASISLYPGNVDRLCWVWFRGGGRRKLAIAKTCLVLETKEQTFPLPQELPATSLRPSSFHPDFFNFQPPPLPSFHRLEPSFGDKASCSPCKNAFPRRETRKLQLGAPIDPVIITFSSLCISPPSSTVTPDIDFPDGNQYMLIIC